MGERQPNGSLPDGLIEKTRYANTRLSLETSASFLAALHAAQVPPLACSCTCTTYSYIPEPTAATHTENATATAS